LEVEGVDLILDIDTQGAKKVAKEISQPVSIYLLPPSLRVLKDRLVNRGVDSPERVKFRWSSARRDMEEAYGYQYVIVNDRIEDALEKLKSIIVAERCRRAKNIVLESIMKEWEEKDG
jgi:guanylate kinase